MGYVCPWWRSTGGGSLSSYKNEKRDLNYLALAYGKMIYASAYGMSSVWGKNVIDQSGTIVQEDLEDVDPDGEFTDDAQRDSIQAGDPDSRPAVIGTPPASTASSKPRKTSKVDVSGLYSEGGMGDDGKTPKYYPKPHIVSISTSGMDSLGLNQKGTLTYKTYAGWQGKSPPSIGSTLSMSWGWAYGGTVINGAGFSGKVMGWSSTANMEGGYDVTVDMLGSNASVNAASMAADQASVNIGDGPAVDKQGNKISSSGPLSAIAACESEAISAAAANPSFTFNNGIQGAIIEIPEDFDKEKTDDTKAEASKMTYRAFVTFASIVELCNKVITQYTDGVKFVIDTTAKSPINIPGGLQSGHPLQLLTPGTSTYGAKTFSCGGGGFNGDPSNLYIAADWAKGIIEQVKVIETQSEGGKSRSLSFKTFFDSIFKMFNENLGNLYALTLANSAEKNDSNIYIVDYNNVQSIGAHNVGAVRSATCTAKMDGEQAAMFYTIANAPKDAGSSNLVQGGDKAAPVAPDYGTHLSNLGSSGVIPANIAAIRADNKALVAAQIAGSSNITTAAPWDLSVTVDGSGGFKYGGVITADVVPGSPIPGYRVGFAITNIQHNVSAGDWTTSLSTYCRIYK